MGTQPYLDTYVECRVAFLELAAQRCSRLRSHVLEGLPGLDDEELAMDVATIGDPEARKALILVCGTHGLEGAPGSVAQRRFISGCGRLPDGVKIVAVHALNPWGFSHASRTDHANIDPNRNFIDFETQLPISLAYGELHAAQCPDAWCDDASDILRSRIIEIVKRVGLPYAMDGLTVGQHQEPTGLNFGGLAPSWPNRTIRQVVAEELSACEKAAYVEWHSGFGDYGELFHVCLHAPGSDELERAAQWWGREAVTRNGEAFQGTNGVAPNWRGLLIAALPSMIPAASVVGAVIEFGTFDNTKVLEGLMIDRWLRFGHENKSSLTRAELELAKRDIFSPTDPEWRTLVIERALTEQYKALAGLADW